MSRYKAYPEYKESGVEWLGNIPCDWDCVRLKFASELSGKKVAPSNEERYVGLENVQSNSGKFITTEEVTPEGISNAFSCGDVLFGKLRPYLAKSWLADFSGICSSEFLVMTSRKVNSKFLHYFTLTEEFIEQVDSSTYGSKMPRASWDFIGLLDIPIPRHESEKIAAFLDHETAKIDALIEKQQRLIELLKEKRQAVISHAVTKGLNPNAPMKDSGVEWLGEVPEHWVIANLRWFIQIASGDGLSNTVIESDLDQESPYKVIGGNGVMGYSKYLNTVDEAFAIGRVGALCGNVHFINYPCWITDNALKLTNWRNFYPHYLNFLLLAARLNEYANRSAQPLITGEQVKSLIVTIPPYEEQVAIANHISKELDSFSTLMDRCQSAIQMMQERRTALISAAVTGKIDVRDWQPAAVQAGGGVEC